MSKRPTPAADAVIEQEAKRARASLEADAERGVRFAVLNAEDGGALEAAQRALRMQTGKPIPIVRIVWQAEEGLAEKRVGGFVPYNPEWANDTPIPNLSPEEKVRDMRWMLEKAASEGRKRLCLQAVEHWMLQARNHGVLEDDLRVRSAACRARSVRCARAEGDRAAVLVAVACFSRLDI